MRALFSLLLLLFSSIASAGYDLHITRKENWFDDNGQKITFLEWQKYIRQDGQIRKDPLNTKYDFIVSLDGETFPIWYNPDLGELYTKNPSEKAISKLVQIAKALKAKVQGDDGELYPSRPNKSFKADKSPPRGTLPLNPNVSP